MHFPSYVVLPIYIVLPADVVLPSSPPMYSTIHGVPTNVAPTHVVTACAVCAYVESPIYAVPTYVILTDWWTDTRTVHSKSDQLRC